MSVFCKDCNSEFRHAEKASEIYNRSFSVKKDFFRCNCGKIIEEIRALNGVIYK